MFSRGGSLLPSRYADARSPDAVIVAKDPAVHPLRAMPGAAALLPSIWDWNSIGAVLDKLDSDLAAADALQAKISAWFAAFMLGVTDHVSEQVRGLQLPCNMVVDVDYTGNDMPGMPLSVRGDPLRASATACAAACMARRGCSHFTLTASSVCYLKTSRKDSSSSTDGGGSIAVEPGVHVQTPVLGSTSGVCR